MFRSLIHFEFIFVYGVRKCSNFILLQVVDQFSQHRLKRLSFLHYIFSQLAKFRSQLYHGITKGQIGLSVFTFIFHFHALEKEMATYSSTIGWKIPWMEEPGRLQSMG